MEKLFESKLFSLLYDRHSCETEVLTELKFFSSKLIEYYPTKRTLYFTLGDYNLAIAALQCLEAKIKGDPAQGKSDFRLPYIKGLKSALELQANELRNLRDAGELYPEEKDYVYQWTDTKTNLVELAYALYECKCINKGEILVEKFVQDIASFFGLKIKDSARIFINIKERKIMSRTSFLDSLRQSLNDRMVKDDDK